MAATSAGDTPWLIQEKKVGNAPELLFRPEYPMV